VTARGAAANEGVVMDELDTLLWLHLATVGPLVLFKLAVLLVGYLIARLGYRLLLQGVKGEFKFHTKFREGVVDLISVSPGIFFIFMATVLIAVGIVTEKPFETKFSKQATRLGPGSETRLESSAGPPAKPPLPPPSSE